MDIGAATKGWVFRQKMRVLTMLRQNAGFVMAIAIAMKMTLLEASDQLLTLIASVIFQIQTSRQKDLTRNLSAKMRFPELENDVTMPSMSLKVNLRTPQCSKRNQLTELMVKKTDG